MDSVWLFLSCVPATSFVPPHYGAPILIGSRLELTVSGADSRKFLLLVRLPFAYYYRLLHWNSTSFDEHD